MDAIPAAAIIRHSASTTVRGVSGFAWDYPISGTRGLEAAARFKRHVCGRQLEREPYSVDAATGKQRWRFKVDGPWGRWRVATSWFGGVQRHDLRRLPSTLCPAQIDANTGRRMESGSLAHRPRAGRYTDIVIIGNAGPRLKGACAAASRPYDLKTGAVGWAPLLAALRGARSWVPQDQPHLPVGDSNVGSATSLGVAPAAEVRLGGGRGAGVRC